MFACQVHVVSTYDYLITCVNTVNTVSHVDLFIRFYQNEMEKKKIVLTINQINMNYEKPNK